MVYSTRYFFFARPFPSIHYFQIFILVADFNGLSAMYFVFVMFTVSPTLFIYLRLFAHNLVYIIIISNYKTLIASKSNVHIFVKASHLLYLFLYHRIFFTSLIYILEMVEDKQHPCFKPLVGIID